MRLDMAAPHLVTRQQQYHAMHDQVLQQKTAQLINAGVIEDSPFVDVRHQFQVVHAVVNRQLEPMLARGKTQRGLRVRACQGLAGRQAQRGTSARLSVRVMWRTLASAVAACKAAVVETWRCGLVMAKTPYPGRGAGSPG